MIDLFSKEFDLMCFVKDTKVMCGVCLYDVVAEKFGEQILKKCIYGKKIIYIDKREGGLDWTDFGKRCMDF